MFDTHHAERRLSPIAAALVVLVAGTTAVGLIGGAGAPALEWATGDDDPDNAAIETIQQDNVSEEAYVEPAPEEGDEYFEAASSDWVSYDNPRDDYRTPYNGDGSGKICLTLLNEAGEFVIGESVPNTTVTVPTNDSLKWHEYADPMTVEFPMNEHHEFALDGDQFGTTSDLPQGDGYMDSHCIEFHGFSQNGASVGYGEAQIEGEHADRIDVVGYIQKAHDTWDTSVDPIADAESYEEAGGGWTYEPGGSHGQAVIVLQLNGSAVENETDPVDDNETVVGNDTDGNGTVDDPTNGSVVDDPTNESDLGDATNDTQVDDGTDDADGKETDSSSDDGDDESGADDEDDSNSSDTGDETTDPDLESDGQPQPGFGIPAALVALLTGATAAIRRRY